MGAVSLMIKGDSTSRYSFLPTKYHFTPPGTRTRNLNLRRVTPYPLGQQGSTSSHMESKIYNGSHSYHPVLGRDSDTTTDNMDLGINEVMKSNHERCKSSDNQRIDTRLREKVRSKVRFNNRSTVNQKIKQ